DNARQRALHGTGSEIRFRLKSPTVKISIGACEIVAQEHGGGLAQILFGDFSYTYFPVKHSIHEIEVTAPSYENLEQGAAGEFLFHPRLMRILLPTHSVISHLSIEGEIAPPQPGDVPSKRALHYGSSITQGSGSITSREDWASRCSHLLGADLINLGFGGGCHCEPEMADYLCERDDFDYAVLETGINMLDLDPAIADTRIENLIRRFSEAHPDKPTFCLGVFPCGDDFRNPTNGRAQQIRELVRSTVADIGAPHLHFIDGKKALHYPRGMTVDLVHPSPAGMIEIGSYVAASIERTLS
ncbi:MAG: GDSL-type esterase/lipase family protein, partial [Puniceicoccales bacterium]